MGANNEAFSLDNPHVFARGSMKRRLPASMTPHEILSKFRFGDMSGSLEEQINKGKEEGGRDWFTEHTLIGNRNGVAESDGYASLEESMKAKGFDTSKPIVLNANHSMGPTVIDGHHRLVMANHLDPHTPIPVMYTNDEKYNITKNVGTRFKKQPVKTNMFEANCKACGQKVAAEQGSIIKFKNGPWHTYHTDHLTESVKSMYRANPPRKK